MRRSILLLTILLTSLLSIGTFADTGVPTLGSLPEELPIQTEVKDPIFSILVGLVMHDLYGTLDGEHLERALERSGKKTDLPYRELVSLTRSPVEARATANVTVVFKRDLDLAIPYHILGYHPGAFEVAETCVFREWILGTMHFRHPYKERGEVKVREIAIEEAHLFGLDEGKVAIDVDAWIDHLLGGAIDDTNVKALMLFKYDGRWIGLATGYATDHSGRTGAFDFAKDEIMFPGPDEMKTVGRTMRGRTEEWLKNWPDWVGTP